MDEIKEKALSVLTEAKAAIWNFFISHQRKIILILCLILAVLVAAFALNQVELNKKENAQTINVNLIEGQSYSFVEVVKSYELNSKYLEFIDVSVDDQKIYALDNYTDGKIEFMGKMEDGTYRKFVVIITSLDTEMSQNVNIPKNSTVTVRDWSADYIAEWSSSDSQIATVDQDGNVTGIELGECDIVAKITNEVLVTYHVTVVDVALSPSTPYIYIGDSLTYKVLGYEPSEDEKFKLESDNSSVATVRGMKVRGIGEGTATITLSLNNNTYTSTLSVLGNPSVEDISVTVNGTVDVVAKNIPNFADCEELKIGNDDIAIFENGKVTGKSIGVTSVVGKIKGHEFSFNIAVTGASLVPQENIVYDTTFNKYNHYDNLVKYSVKENDSIKIYFTNANTKIPSAKTQDNNFRIFDVTEEYVEITGTNPGVGLLAIDFDDHRIYAEIHVQHTNSSLTQREWEVALKKFTDTLRTNGDWIYSEETHSSYFDAKNDISRRINSVSFVNYILQDLEILSMENSLSINEYGKVSGTEQTMQTVKKYFDIIESEAKIEPTTLNLGDIVIWNDGSASIFMGLNNGNTLTWYEVDPDLAEADGFFARFYSESNKSNLEIVQILRLHYTV